MIKAAMCQVRTAVNQIGRNNLNKSENYLMVFLQLLRLTLQSAVALHYLRTLSRLIKKIR